MPAGIQDSLRQRGVRLTRQRRLLLELIDHSGLHLDAESLYQMAKEKDAKLNRVTVYRTLKLLKEGGLVDELDLAHFQGDQHYYETRLKQEHAHIICLRCGRVEEFFGEELQHLRSQVESQFGFEIVFAQNRNRRLLLALPGACARRRRPRPRLVEPGPRDMDAAARHPEMRKGLRAGVSAGSESFRPAHPRRALEPLPFLLGRHADNNLVLRDNRVSRTHARIFAENGHYVIEDLNSRHGTWVNGAQIAPPRAAQLRPHRLRRARILSAHLHAGAGRDPSHPGSVLHLLAHRRRRAAITWASCAA